MKKIFLTLGCIALIFTSACNNDDYDPLGDLIVNLVRDNPFPANPLLNEIEIGVFPSECLLTNDFSPGLAFKRATVDLDVEEDEVPSAVITNILPGTYVLAFVSFSSSESTSRQVIQITADDVTVVDLNF